MTHEDEIVKDVRAHVQEKVRRGEAGLVLRCRACVKAALKAADVQEADKFAHSSKRFLVALAEGSVIRIKCEHHGVVFEAHVPHMRDVSCENCEEEP